MPAVMAATPAACPGGLPAANMPQQQKKKGYRKQKCSNWTSLLRE
jgi:hypothetical protein